eukprot:5838175-Prymnesium_polylepis.1
MTLWMNTILVSSTGRRGRGVQLCESARRDPRKMSLHELRALCIFSIQPTSPTSDWHVGSDPSAVLRSTA